MTKIVDGKTHTSKAARWFPMTGDKAGKMWSIIRDHIFVEHGHDLDQRKDGLSLHSVRHTAATRLIEDGASRYDVQKHLGHTSIQVTQGYVHADRSDAHRIAQVRDRAA